MLCTRASSLRRGLRIERRVGLWRAALAGRRHRGRARRRRLDHRLADRPLADEQVLDLIARKRLELEETARERFELGALLVENAVRVRITCLDQTTDLGVDLAAPLPRQFFGSAPP